jgi:hypothetical protein
VNRFFNYVVGQGAGSFLAIALIAVGPFDAAAQSVLPFAPGRVSIAGGPTFALGDLGDVVDAGYHASLSAGVSVPLLPVGLRIDGMFTQFPESDGDANFRVLSGSVNGVVSIPSIGFSPYLIGGIGFYNSRFTADGEGPARADGSTTDVGANAGVGLRVGLPGLALFGEMRLHNLFSDGGSTRFAPLSLGISF